MIEENKLQALTEKLYGEGLEKGRAEGERLVAEAKKESEQIIAEARKRAEQIVRDAESKAADTEKNTLTEITLAGRQAVATIKAEIADAIIARAAGESVSAAMLDTEFVKQLILDVARNWNGASEGRTELRVLLPESRRRQLDEAFAKCTSELLAEGVEVGWSKDVKSGFRAGAKDGGYYISFTDESFDALLRSYLREKVFKMLYQAE